jgi:hypothetical protein
MSAKAKTTNISRESQRMAEKKKKREKREKKKREKREKREKKKKEKRKREKREKREKSEKEIYDNIISNLNRKTFTYDIWQKYQSLSPDIYLSMPDETDENDYNKWLGIQRLDDEDNDSWNERHSERVDDLIVEDSDGGFTIQAYEEFIKQMKIYFKTGIPPHKELTLTAFATDTDYNIFDRLPSFDFGDQCTHGKYFTGTEMGIRCYKEISSLDADEEVDTSFISKDVVDYMYKAKENEYNGEENFYSNWTKLRSAHKQEFFEVTTNNFPINLAKIMCDYL